MGWASGTELLGSVLEIVLPYVPKSHRLRVAGALIDAFEFHDCDTWEDLADRFPEVRAVANKRFGDYYEDE